MRDDGLSAYAQSVVIGASLSEPHTCGTTGFPPTRNLWLCIYIAEKVGAPYHKGPKRYVGKRKLWGTRFSETEESIKGKIEGVLEGKGEVLVRKVEVEDKGRVKWWYWIEANELILRRLEDIKDMCDKYWKLESSPFLGGVKILPKKR